jgi:predicted phage baseplate assembly protein
MPIVSPQLDDLTYDRVVAELKRRIPVYSPEWTDFNDSDPGITLIQLFAYLSEMIGYRLNRIPEKNQIELLQLLGIELNPAHAATTKLAFILSDPTTLTAYTLSAGASAKATTGSPPPSFETDVDIDITPAQPTVLVTTVNENLNDPGNPGATPTSVGTDFLRLIWDGKSPSMKDLPLAPAPLTPATLQPANNQRYLWIGVNYNSALDAGFRGVQVALTIRCPGNRRADYVAFLLRRNSKQNAPRAGAHRRYDQTTGKLRHADIHRSDNHRPDSREQLCAAIQPGEPTHASAGLRCFGWPFR